MIVSMSVNHAWANGTIEIVSDPWPPYVYEEDNKVVGTDAEITTAVLTQMGLKSNISLLPWKRCLGMVKTLKADAILAASITEERKDFLFFPSEPVSTGITVFFKKTSNPLNSINLDNPANLRTGAILGYNYCDTLDNSRLIESASRVATLEQNFKKLLLGRLDLVAEVESVGFFKAKEMNISDQLEIVANARYCAGGNYLAFAKKPAYDELAEKFSVELEKFKSTTTYQKILQKYGLPHKI